MNIEDEIKELTPNQEETLLTTFLEKCNTYEKSQITLDYCNQALFDWDLCRESIDNIPTQVLMDYFSYMNPKDIETVINLYYSLYSHEYILVDDVYLNITPLKNEEALINYIMKYVKAIDLIDINKELDDDEKLKYALNKANKVN